MNKPSLRAAQSKIADICRQFYGAIPLQDIFDACIAAGFQPVQEDGTPWSGFLCGADGRATIELAGSKKCLQLQWHKFEVTGRYEINAYIS